jgi:prophage antirepressor-like protein
MSTQIAINGWNLVSSDDLEGHWMTGEEIGKHLGYADPRTSVRMIWERHKDSFKKDIDVSEISLISEAGPRTTRVFSERGTLKVIRYSNTEVADSVMEEVFDLYLAVRKISSSGKVYGGKSFGVDAKEAMKIEVKAAKMCVQFITMATKLGLTKARARKKAVEEVKQLTGVDFASIFQLDEEAEFLESNDPVALFIKENCIILDTEYLEKLGLSVSRWANFVKEKSLSRDEFVGRYIFYCREKGCVPESSIRIGKRVRELGFRKGRRRCSPKCREYYFSGLAFRGVLK